MKNIEPFVMKIHQTEQEKNSRLKTSPRLNGADLFVYIHSK